MATKGRKPLPTALKVLEGDRGKGIVYTMEIDWVSKKVILRADCLDTIMRRFIDTLCIHLDINEMF